jgi:alkylated DNA repair dioxygenase AlkB
MRKARSFVFYSVDTLFPVEPIFPKGFNYFPNFITVSEESELIKQISGIDLQTFHFQGYEAKRKVASFGFDYNFEKKTLSRGKEIPPSFLWIIEKVAKHLNIAREAIAELLLTEYPTGSVINWHRDAFPFDLVAGISLSDDCMFRLRPHDKTKQGKNSIISFPVHKRSLYVLAGQARTEWQHSIAPVKSVRYSITLRTLKTRHAKMWL